MLCVGNPKDVTKNNRINTFSCRKKNIQKSVAFYTLIMSYYKEKLRKLSFTTALKGINIFRNKSNQREKWLVLLKPWDVDEINQRWNTNKWKDTSCSWIERINSVKMAIPFKAIYRFKAISIKIPMGFFFFLAVKEK